MDGSLEPLGLNDAEWAIGPTAANSEPLGRKEKSNCRSRIGIYPAYDDGSNSTEVTAPSEESRRMGVIANPRGASGSGKTELVRRILADYGWGKGGEVEPIHHQGRDRPIAYRLSHPLGGRPLAVLGHYEATCGGCDTIRLVDGGLDEAFRLADVHASSGHDVLLEGLLLSAEHRRSAALAEAHELHVMHLDTPLSRCIQNVIARRRAGRYTWPTIARTAAMQQSSINQACERLRWCAEVEAMSFDAALMRLRKLFGLERLGVAA